MHKDIGDKTHVNANQIHLNSSSHKCGYCHGKKTGGTKTWGLVSEKTRVDDYEAMMNRGWRRCGTYYYKTDLKGSCCQLYTIKLNAKDFVLSYKQRKALIKFNRFLNGELEHKLMKGKKSEKDTKEDKKEKKEEKVSATLEKYEKSLDALLIKTILEIIMKESAKLGAQKLVSFADIKPKIKTTKTKLATFGDFSTNAALVIYNEVKRTNGGKEGTPLKEVQQIIVEKIKTPCSELKFTIQQTENGYINFKAEFDLQTIVNKELGKEIQVQKIQTEDKKDKKDKKDQKEQKEKKEKKEKKPKGEIKKNEEPKPGEDVKAEAKTEVKKEEEKKKEPPQFQYSAYFKEFVPNMNPNPKHVYTVEIVPSIATQETYQIYNAYQIEIHKEKDNSFSGYSSFLCDSPLYDPKNEADSKRPFPLNDTKRKLTNQGVWPKFLGSYHMYHKIDGKIIAVGVLDYIPTVISSVYFFYDPTYKFLNLGIIGALREIEYVRKIQESHCPTFENYYMGYFIPDCIKSVYKGDYQPSFLMCPETYTWHPLEKIKEKITKVGYARLAEPSVDVIPDMKFSEEDMKKITNDYTIRTEDDYMLFGEVNKKFKVVLDEVIKKLGKSLLDHLAWTT